MQTFEYFAPGFSCIEEVEAAHGPIWDASTLQKIADCPRKHEERVEKNLTKPGTSPKMQAGIAIHAGLEFYYAHANRGQEAEDHAIQICESEWAKADINRALMEKSEVHLNGPNLAQVMRNYFTHWNRTVTDIFAPISGLHLSDLRLDQVLAARFRLTDSEEIILGESNLVMTFTVEGEQLVLAGKPDLPVTKQDGSVWSMDHKTTSSYLSDWWARSYEVSNKDRGYMAMLEALLDKRVRGTVINGIYIGEYALSPTSKAVKFHRFPFDFSADHVKEALKNQWAWKKTADFYRQLGYWPQGCSYGGCAMPDLCRLDPDTREEVRRTDYMQSTRRFWDL